MALFSSENLKGWRFQNLPGKPAAVLNQTHCESLSSLAAEFSLLQLVTSACCLPFCSVPLRRVCLYLLYNFPPGQGRLQ